MPLHPGAVGHPDHQALSQAAARRLAHLCAGRCFLCNSGNTCCLQTSSCCALLSLQPRLPALSSIIFMLCIASFATQVTGAVCVHLHAVHCFLCNPDNRRCLHTSSCCALLPLQPRLQALSAYIFVRNNTSYETRCCLHATLRWMLPLPNNST